MMNLRAGVPSVSGAFQPPSCIRVFPSRFYSNAHAGRRTANLVAASGDDTVTLTPSNLRGTPRLSAEEVLERLGAGVHAHARESYAAMFSSELGGIVTDPALMVVHMDDHIVHRGHGVFDTAHLCEGYLYQLDQHLARFFRSAERAHIGLPYSEAKIRKIILDTAAASRAWNGEVRYWASAGRGGFGLTTKECVRPSFYVQVIKRARKPVDISTDAMKVKTTPIPIKPPQFATVKSVNYLPNALALKDAEDSGFDQGIFVDEKGFVAEGPNMNVLVVTKDDELVTPPFESALDGLTVQRAMELCRLALDNKLPAGDEGDEIRHLKAIVQRPLTVDECKAAKEVMLVGSGVQVFPVQQWDERKIGGYGKPGLVCLTLRALILQDMYNPSREQHVEVPFGILTNMSDSYRQ